MSDYLFDKRAPEAEATAEASTDAATEATIGAATEATTGAVRDPDDLTRDVQHLESLLGAFAHRAPLRELPPQRALRTGRAWRRFAVPAALTAALVAAAAIFLWLRDPRPQTGQPIAQAPSRSCTTHPFLLSGSDPATGPIGPVDPASRRPAGFAFSLSGGAARCDGADSAAEGVLPVGAWLETENATTADVRLADIGELTVYGDSRLRLVGTSAQEHRLELARGKVTARVIAPPRLFVVDTPGATAVDLGCAYELTVDDDGRTHLRVTSGAVSLEGHGKVSYAPALTEVLALPGRGPGTPIAFGAAPAFRDAVTRFDQAEAGERPTDRAAALATALTAATAGDTVTLWNLLPRTEAADRAAVLARLEALSPRPDGVSAAAILANDAAALELWRQDLEREWGGNVRKLRPHR